MTVRDEDGWPSLLPMMLHHRTQKELARESTDVFPRTHHHVKRVNERAPTRPIPMADAIYVPPGVGFYALTQGAGTA
jgi:hypothetical protein